MNKWRNQNPRGCPAPLSMHLCDYQNATICQNEADGHEMDGNFQHHHHITPTLCDIKKDFTSEDFAET